MDKTTITLTKDAKKVLDKIGRKNENYSDLVVRLAKQVDSICSHTKDAEESSEIEEEIQDEE